jgi:hypothetical protein
LAGEEGREEVGVYYHHGEVSREEAGGKACGEACGKACEEEAEGSGV